MTHYGRDRQDGELVHLSAGMSMLAESTKAKAVIEIRRRWKRQDAKRKVRVIIWQQCKGCYKQGSANASAVMVW